MGAKKSIGGNVYKGEDGFYIRPWVDGRRTWRKLAALTERFALKEAREKLSAQERSKQGTDRDPFKEGETFSAISELYLSAGCPNKRMEPRPRAFCDEEARRIEYLRRFFGGYELQRIKLATLPAYKTWRVANLKRATSGGRAVEVELSTLSNVLNYAVSTGHLDFNYIRSGRPRFQPEHAVKHSREFAPADADEIHRMGDYFLADPRSEVMAWAMFFAAMSGCRISELVRLRTDARSMADPGYIESNYIFLRRSKNGINPYIHITPDFQSMLQCFWNWHTERWPEGHPFYFPGREGKGAIRTNSFSHSIMKCARALKLPARKGHGFRSYYVTKRRSDGADDRTIAAEIGDKTVSLISLTYGDVPPNWVGQKKLGNLPSEGLPAWERWRPAAQKVINISP